MKNQTKKDFFKESLLNPVTQEMVKHIDETEIEFTCSSKFPVRDGTPIIIDEMESIFSIDDIISKKATTQDSNYRKKSLKNTIRQKVLPSLSKDYTLIERYEMLAKKHINGKILIIGSGDKVEWYKSLFSEKALVIASDVHSQFNPDIVFDCHQIPFINETFDLVIAGQVLEHTFKPWIAAKEIERVTKVSGNILIEVPFNFPYHSPPYDFYRFTFTGLRSLFPTSNLNDFEITEGKASTVAIFNSQFLIECFSSRGARIVMLFISRILFGWLKYLDRLGKKKSIRSLSMPKGFSMTFEKDNINRKNYDLLNEYFDIKNKS